MLDRLKQMGGQGKALDRRTMITAGGALVALVALYFAWKTYFPGDEEPAPAAATPAASATAPATPPTTATAGTDARPSGALAAPVSGPNINGPKAAAQRAVNAENERLAAQTGQDLPGRAAPRSGPGSAPAAGAISPTSTTASTGPSLGPMVTREMFAYEGDGRRDPFYSLILTEDIRPLLSDLKLVGILYDASNRRSVAIMRDLLTNAQYRVGPGQTIGRMRVAQIRPKGVIFTMDEFGLSRQDSLMLSDTTKVRN